MRPWSKREREKGRGNEIELAINKKKEQRDRRTERERRVGEERGEEKRGGKSEDGKSRKKDRQGREDYSIGLVVQSVMSATDTLVHWDVRGLSAMDPRLRHWISAHTLPKDVGMPL